MMSTSLNHRKKMESPGRRFLNQLTAKLELVNVVIAYVNQFIASAKCFPHFYTNGFPAISLLNKAMFLKD